MQRSEYSTRSYNRNNTTTKYFMIGLGIYFGSGMVFVVIRKAVIRLCCHSPSKI